MSTQYRELTTYGHETIPEIPWDVYPRPQFKRESFINLNGVWDFTAHDAEMFTSQIRVPYPVESKLSGIQKHFPEGTPLWYSRELPPISFMENKCVVLHIDAVDQEADVYINDQFVSHIKTFEGYDGIDITAFLQENNTVSICVTDDLNKKEFPYGKQTLKRGGMWYTPFSGIWQSVWIEIVPKERIQSILIETSLTEATVTIKGQAEGVVLFEGNEYSFTEGKIVLSPKDPICWTPENPKLYEFTIRSGEDEVTSYFALRTLAVKETENGQRLCLNGKPYFFHGLLDQGYWPDGLCTPPDPSCFEEDILAMKREESSSLNLS